MIEQTSGYLNVAHAGRVQELLGIADEQLVRYGNPPPSVVAEFKDGDGHIYRGTLYLVRNDQPAKEEEP
jgi:hypothetical protein